MRVLLCLLLPWCLSAQAPLPRPELTLDLHTALGSEPFSGLRLAPRGCWDGLLLGTRAQPAPPPRRRSAEATVEVWDLALREAPNSLTFSFYLGTLRQRLSKAFEQPPPSHQAIELGDIMLNDPSQPQKLDLTKVMSLQDRFNRLPPNGSPVKQP